MSTVSTFDFDTKGGVLMEATMALRWVRRWVQRDGDNVEEKVLQQCWRERETGKPTWRDVPTEIEK